MYIANFAIASGTINAKDQHLILSSSNGSIVNISSSLKLGQYAQANLPAGLNTLSGSVVWVSDLKTAAIYGPEGWQRVLTGAL